MSIFVILLIIFVILVLNLKFEKGDYKPTIESLKNTTIIIALFLIIVSMGGNKPEYSLPKINNGSIIYNEKGATATYENTNVDNSANNSFNNTINNSDSICHQGRVTTEDETRSVIPKFREEIQEVINSNTSKICTRFPMALAFFENGGRHRDKNGNVAQSRNAQGELVGAIGLMQVMPFHAHTGGICAGMDLYNVKDNIRCGYKIAKSELIKADKFYNSEPDKAYDAILLAAAAYNAGWGRAEKALEQGWKETKPYALGVSALYFLDIPIYDNSKLNQSKGGTEVLANVFSLALKAQLALKKSGEFLGFEKINASKSLNNPKGLNDFTINVKDINSESVKKLIKEMRTHTTISFNQINQIKFSLNGNGEKYINSIKLKL